MKVYDKPLLHEPTNTISLCAWFGDESDVDVGTFNW
jgi:hypothetical protein